MQLDGSQAQRLYMALLDAFPQWGDLAMMVRFGLNQSLETIAGAEGQELRAVVFKLISRAETEGWVDRLAEAAQAHNPGNVTLRTIAHEIRQSVDATAGPHILSVEVVSGLFEITEPARWSLSLEIYLEPNAEHPLIIPAHRCTAQIRMPHQSEGPFLADVVQFRIEDGPQLRIVEPGLKYIIAGGVFDKELWPLDPPSDLEGEVCLRLVKPPLQVSIVQTLSGGTKETPTAKSVQWRYNRPRG